MTAGLVQQEVGRRAGCRGDWLTVQRHHVPVRYGLDQVPHRLSVHRDASGGDRCSGSSACGDPCGDEVLHQRDAGLRSMLHRSVPLRFRRGCCCACQRAAPMSTLPGLRGRCYNGRTAWQAAIVWPGPDHGRCPWGNSLTFSSKRRGAPPSRWGSVTALPRRKTAPLLLVGSIAAGDVAGAERVREAGLRVALLTGAEHSTPGGLQTEALGDLALGLWCDRPAAAPTEGVDFQVFCSEETAVDAMGGEGRTVFMQVVP